MGESVEKTEITTDNYRHLLHTFNRFIIELVNHTCAYSSSTIPLTPECVISSPLILNISELARNIGWGVNCIGH